MVLNTEEPPTNDDAQPITEAEDNIKKMKEEVAAEVAAVAAAAMDVSEVNGNGAVANGEHATNGSEKVANGAEAKTEIEETPESANDDAASTSSDPQPVTDEQLKKSDSGNSVECIDIDDEEDKSASAPPAKKLKLENGSAEASPSPGPATNGTSASVTIPAKKDKEPELNSPEALLNKLEEYVREAIDSGKNVDRKVLDALLGAINVQVQKEPLSVRKLILDKQLVLPNTISFPPSSVVDMLIEHDPEFPLTKVISKMFGDERPKLSENEKKERQALKSHNAVPHMTKLLMDIGQDLVQESTYCDIVHAKNLPETPKNIETYKTVAAQLKPVWEALRKKNEPYKLKMLSCQVCGFKTESRLVLQKHREELHFKNGKYHCGLCPDFDTNEQRMMNHYLKAHEIVATKEDSVFKYPCYICEEDFQFKGIRDQHMKVCKKDYIKVRHLLAPKADDNLIINRWLWERPPVDPTILQQQQAAQRKQQLGQTPQGSSPAMRRSIGGTPSSTPTHSQAQQAALLQQQLRQQQAMRQQLQAAAQYSQTMRSAAPAAAAQQQNSLIAAMQQHLQRTQAAQMGRLGNQLAAATAMYQNKLASASKNPQMLAAALQQQQAAAAAAMRSKTTAASKNNQPMPRALSTVTHLNGVSSSSSPPSAASAGGVQTCEICDAQMADKEKYLSHLQMYHKQMRGKSSADMQQGAPLACSRCRDRFWTYEGLERHLVMSHGLVTADLLAKAQKKEDGGRCKICAKQYAFNMLQHLVADHQVKLCSAEIMYSCDVCAFKCSSYTVLEAHLTTVHPKGEKSSKPVANGLSTANGKEKSGECITLDD